MLALATAPADDDKVIAHLGGVVGSKVKVTLEIVVEIHAGTPTTSCGS